MTNRHCNVDIITARNSAVKHELFVVTKSALEPHFELDINYHTAQTTD